jgi:hypothetical protein
MYGTHIRLAAVLTFAAIVLMSGEPARAGSSGNISGTVVAGDAAAPVANASVSATAPTGTYRAVTDARGFYSILNMTPDTYAVTITANGYETTVISGVTVFQDQTLVVGAKLLPATHVMGHVTATGRATNLVQPNVTTNTYNVTAKQMNTILNDSTHHTLYDVLWRTPGVTSGPTNGSPTIRGGTTTELGWEFEGIPIVDRTVGFYTTELSTTGIGNVEVSTGGLAANQGGSNGGVINMVVKQGTYPSFGTATFGMGSPAYSHTLDVEYGGATPNNAWSYFVAGSFTNTDLLYGNPGTFYYEDVAGNDYNNLKDNIVNIKHVFGDRNKDALQFTADVGVGLFRFGYGASPGSQLALINIDKNGNFVLAPKEDAEAWYHWYNIDQLSYSHQINERSYYQARVAQSRNGYIFDLSWVANRGEACIGGPPGCTLQAGRDPNFDFWGYGLYYQDRHTLQSFFNWDYANQLSAKHLLKFGLNYESDTNFRKVADPTSFDLAGNWPDYYSVTLAPTHIYSSYLSDHFVSGKWVVEPGVRWDMEHYGISPVVDATGLPAPGTAHAFSESFLSPRIGIAFEAGPNDVFRGSYAHLGQFIGTAYAENYSVDALGGSGPFFTSDKPQVAKTFDFSWEHQFANDVSLRVTPYFHNNDDYIVEYRVAKSIDPTQRAVFLNGGATHTRGVEAAVSREVNQGLSTFFSFTYNDTKSNVVIAQGPYFGTGGHNDATQANIEANNFLPANFAAPWSSNLGLDWNKNGWEVDSNLTWSTQFPYGNGRMIYAIDPTTNKPVVVPNTGTCTQTNQGLKCLSSGEAPGSFANSLKGPAWFYENISIARVIGRDTKAGISIYNAFNNITSPNLSVDGNYLNTDGANNWTPQPDGPTSFNAFYTAPNAFHYPTAGYYQQQSDPPRQFNFWIKFST